MKIPGIEIYKANEQPPWGIVMAIYGRPGSGKTTLAADAADSEYGRPVAMIDAEGGSRVVSHRSDIEIIPIKKWGDLAKVRNALSSEPTPPYRTLIIDNMSELQNKELQSRVSQTDYPQIRDWGINTNQMLSSTRWFRDYGQQNGVNIFLIAWDTLDIVDEEGSKKTYRQLSFTPSLREQFPGIVDIVGYLTVDENPPVYSRTLSFAPSKYTSSKFRRSVGGVDLGIPNEITFTLENHLMVDLLATLKGKLPWPQSKYISARDLRRAARRSEGATNENQS